MPIEDFSETCFSRFSEQKTFFKKERTEINHITFWKKNTLAQIIVKKKLKYFFQETIFSMF